MTSEKVERLTYTPGEVAEILGLSRSSVYKMIKDGEMPGLRAGARVVVPKKALAKWIEKNTKGG